MLTPFLHALTQSSQRGIYHNLHDFENTLLSGNPVFDASENSEILKTLIKIIPNSKIFISSLS